MPPKFLKKKKTATLWVTMLISNIFHYGVVLLHVIIVPFLDPIVSYLIKKHSCKVFYDPREPKGV